MGVNNLTYSSNGLHLTEGFETKRLLAYDDKRPNYVLQPGDTILGTLTNGYGHTGPDVFIGQIVTDDQIVAWLQKDIAASAACVNRVVTVALTQSQFDALVDFVFNAGPGNFEGSTLLRDLNAGNVAAAADQFDAWVYSKGVKMAGLLRRRMAESALFQAAA